MAALKKTRFDWVDALKALAILGILLNHLVEEFGPGPWFTNPGDNWPDLATRLQQLLPPADHWPARVGMWLGWLGDSGPGVFIFLSGFGLTLSAWQRPERSLDTWAFYRRRLWRLFPLYIAIHLLTYLGLAFVPGQDYSVTHPYALFSLLGLRFRDGLFLYINPSWWFIWLILQLYLLFPLLYRLLRRTSLTWFLILTLAFTFLSRASGLAGIRYSDNLYFWMTGIFFGTRLAEFAVGMALAVLIVDQRERVAAFLRPGRVLPRALAVYVLGLVCSLFWWTTVVSNLLVTLGLSGLFFVLWEGAIRKRLPFLVRPLLWVGLASYGVYLLHQAPLQWTARLAAGWPHLAAALAVLVVSFPAARGIERLVGHLEKSYRRYRTGRGGILFGFLAAAGMLAACKYLDPRLWPEAVYQLFALGMLVSAGLLALLLVKTPGRKWWLWRFLVLTALLATGLKLYVMPVGYYFSAGMLAAVSALLVVLFEWISRRRVLAWGGSLLAVGALLVATERYLVKFRPLETGVRWGEYPALQAHPSRVYSLKADLEIRLRYNNYDYLLKTNAHGLASPEIAAERPDSQALRILIIGDAFSMPEGMAYERSYPAGLEKLLRDSLGGRKVQVINGGVTGYGPREQLPQLAELAPLFRPDIVLYQFFINEFSEIRLPAEARLANIGLVTDQTGWERRVYGSQLMTYANKLERDWIAVLKNREPDYKYQKSLLGFYEKDNSRFYGEENLGLLRTALHQMREECRAVGAGLWLAFVPGQVEVSRPEDIAYLPRDVDLADTTRFDLDQPRRYTRALARELSLPFIDLTPALKAHEVQPVYFPESWHWNPEGHSVVARTLYQELKERAFGEAGRRSGIFNTTN